MSKKSAENNAAPQGVEKQETEVTNEAPKDDRYQFIRFQLGYLVPEREGMSKTSRARQIQALAAIVNSLGCRDMGELLLGVNMVAAHVSGMNLLRSAASSADPAVVTDCNRAANRSFATYAGGLELLKRLHGGGQQKILVQYENLDDRIKTVDNKQSAPETTAEPAQNAEDVKSRAAKAAKSDRRKRFSVV